MQYLCYQITREMQQKNVLQQGLKQIQKLSPQQVLEVRILELSTQELLQRVETELLDNEALEKGADETEQDYDESSDDEERYTGPEDVLRDPEDDNDGGPVGVSASTMDVASWQIRSEVSFHDQLMEQLGETSLTEDQQFIVQYLIGSLEEDGLLHKDLQKIADEMYLYVGVQVSLDELENALHILQQFEPAGIGGRDLQECLLLQVQRRPMDELNTRLAQVLTENFDAICSNRWDKIAALYGWERDQIEALRHELTRLNPRPGGSLHTDRAEANSILPDFLLTVEDNEIQLTLNNASVPSLHVSESFAEALQAAARKNHSKKEAEELAYIQDKMERAQAFILAIRQRNSNLLNTMWAIIRSQKNYFLTGDEGMLRPLTMKEVAALAKVDISTVSRVCNSKFVQTPYGTFPLKRFFIERFNPKGNQTDEDITTQEVREKLKEIIDAEDKREPYSDSQLQKLLAEAGYDIARRTVAKYREQLGLENGRMRKQL